jgi:hypothetical protein
MKMTEIVFSSYPCVTHATHWYMWFWFSEKIPSALSEKEITFRLEFDVTSRLRYLGAWFMIPPRTLKIESS